MKTCLLAAVLMAASLTSVAAPIISCTGSCLGTDPNFVMVLLDLPGSLFDLKANLNSTEALTSLTVDLSGIGTGLVVSIGGNEVLSVPGSVNGVYVLQAAALAPFTTVLFEGDNFQKLHAKITGFTQPEINPQSTVPEPGSFALLVGGFGLIGIGVARRKRKPRSTV